MGYLRKFLWLWVILGMIFVTVVISLVFFFINLCISRRGKHRILQLQKPSSFNVESNKYQEREPSIPPLPPRTQFLTAEAQSYENLAEVPDYEEALPEDEENVNEYEEALPEDEENVNDYEEALPEDDENVNDYEQALPEYEKNMNDYEQALPEYEKNMNDYEQALPEYEKNVNDYEQALPEYEQNTDELPDYVKVNGENEIFPPAPQYVDPDTAGDNTSTEDYDDIGEEAEDQEEDYDDVA
ncbi:hypothetical protein EXN66_Car021509 [Channa argus]|uniref:Uncharacterized protein n=1 Tax=Channa argus TaxID=215402 RepID=A0A6G1QUC6_CHAAH|nr:hypothetical protein EXN66_Car021509 [Channa argus]KAK2881955.1 hypothetical protein Q8A73_022465 [Channa argus]